MTSPRKKLDPNSESKNKGRKQKGRTIYILKGPHTLNEELQSTMTSSIQFLINWFV
jgi:hypothetical protein